MSDLRSSERSRRSISPKIKLFVAGVWSTFPLAGVVLLASISVLMLARPFVSSQQRELFEFSKGFVLHEELLTLSI